MQFSDALVNQYVSYMRRHHAVCISREQAQIHLASLSRLYLAFFSAKQGVGGSSSLSLRPHPLGGRSESES